MDFTYESVVFFLTIICLAFCCGLLRGLRQYFNKTNAAADVQVPERMIVTHIRLQRAAAEAGRHESVSTVFPGGPPSPPPYSVVSSDTSFIANVPPPSYDDVLKQMNTSPKATAAESGPS